MVRLILFLVNRKKVPKNKNNFPSCPIANWMYLYYNVIVQGGQAMKKKNIINLIKYYAEKDDASFKNEANEIALDFHKTGDEQLARYVISLLSDANTFVPQVGSTPSQYLRKVEFNNSPLPLPKKIKEDVIGIVNAASHNVGVNKFLFQGAPGTGKTETVKHIARLLERELFLVDFDSLINSKLGQTSKNISSMFQDLNRLSRPEKILVLFDEIDAIAMDRTNSNDMREMGRATSSFLKGMENINDYIVVIATTNLYDSFDKAMIRRFDSVIDFNRYTRDELVDIAEILLNDFLSKFNIQGRDIRLFKKIINQLAVIPYPGDLKNLIKTSVAFSNSNVEYDYLRRLYHSIDENYNEDVRKLYDKGFTLREIEILTGVSKSQVARIIKG